MKRKTVTMDIIVNVFLRNQSNIFIGQLLAHYVKFFTIRCLKYHRRNNTSNKIGFVYFEDIVNDATSHLLTRLVHYNNTRGSFKWWCLAVIDSFVSRSFMKYYKKNKQIHLSSLSSHCNSNEDANIDINVCDQLMEPNRQIREKQFFLREEFRTILASLLQKYPEYEELLVRMYGDPSEEGFVANCSFNIVKICKQLKLNKNNTMYFLSSKIYPELRKLKTYMTVCKKKPRKQRQLV